MRIRFFNQTGTRQIHEILNANDIPRRGEWIKIQSRGPDVVGEVITVHRFYPFRDAEYIDVWLGIV